MTAEATKVTLTVENPKPHTRYYVVAQPVYQPPAYVLNSTHPFTARTFGDDETVDSDDTRTSSSSDSSYNMPLTVPAKQVRNTQPQCSVRSCSKFCKRGAKLCGKCEIKATQEQERISLERAARK
jgi:hypothetical protein